MGKDKAPILLLARSAIIYLFVKDLQPKAPPEISPIPSAIITPLGLYPYPGIHRLLFIPIAYVGGDGSVGHVQVRRLYLEIAVDTMATSLQLSLSDFGKSLADYSRIAIIGGLVGDRPMLLYDQLLASEDALKAVQAYVSELQLPEGIITSYSPLYDSTNPYPLPQIGDEHYACYYATSKDPDEIENMKRLEATAKYCLDNHLHYLPPSVLNGWKADYLQPLLAHLKSKLESTDKGVGT